MCLPEPGGQGGIWGPGSWGKHMTNLTRWWQEWKIMSPVQVRSHFWHLFHKEIPWSVLWVSILIHEVLPPSGAVPAYHGTWSLGTSPETKKGESPYLINMGLPRLMIQVFRHIYGVNGWFMFTHWYHTKRWRYPSTVYALSASGGGRRISSTGGLGG